MQKTAPRRTDLPLLGRRSVHTAANLTTVPEREDPDEIIGRHLTKLLRGTRK